MSRLLTSGLTFLASSDGRSTSEVSDEVQGLVDRILTEGPIGASEAAGYFGVCRQGRRSHPSKVGRYILQGVKLANGDVLKLEAIRINGRFMTSRAAIVRFVARQQESGPAGQSVEPVRPPVARRRAADEAAKQLELMGC